MVPPGDPIYFFVGGEPGNTTDFGTFDIEVNSSSDCSACAREDNGQVTINPRNATGTYACGSTVEVCFTLFEFNGNASSTVEFLHSIIPTFGTGWDVTSITPTALPNSCDGLGEWRWYPDGWTGCGSGDFYERGFAYETGNGFDNSCGLNTPGNNYGDGANGCINLPRPMTWCWNISVLDCPPASGTFTGDDLTVGVTVLSDGYSGSWDFQACPPTYIETIATVIVCNDEDPIVTGTNETCPNTDDGTLTVNPNGGLDPAGAYNFVIRDAAADLVASCPSCTGEQTFTDLPPGEYTIETTGVLSGCPRIATFTIAEGIAPTGDADHSDVCPDGGPIQLFGSTTEPGTTFSYAWTGPGGFTSSDQNPFTNDPADEGTYRLTVTVDGCPSDPILVDVEYLTFDPQVSAITPEVCFGGDIELEVTGEGDNYAWTDPDGLPVGGNSPTLTTTATVAGTRTYSVVVSDANCSTTLMVDVAVRPEITAQITMNPNGRVCQESEITFNVTQADGSSFPSGWTFSWDGGASFDDNYSYTPFFSGNETVMVVITSPDGNCTETFMEPYIVDPLPMVQLSTTNATICPDGSVTITATASLGRAPYDYLWNPGGFSTSESITIDANSPTLTGLFVEVTDNRGCTTDSEVATVTIIDELPAVTFADCNVTSTTEITFNWDDVGQDHFEVYVTVDGTPEETVSLNYLDLEHTVNGLPEGTEVTIRVVPVATDNGTSCPGAEATTSCTTQACTTPVPTLSCLEQGLDSVAFSWTDVGATSYIVNEVSVPAGGTTEQVGNTFIVRDLAQGESVTISVTAIAPGCTGLVSDEITCVAQSCPDVTPVITTPVDTFCLDGTPTAIPLAVTVPVTGDLSWTGPGVTGASFDPAAAGVGAHVITATYTEGTCSYSATIEFVVVAQPNVSFTVSESMLCQGSASLFTYTGDTDASYTYAWELPTDATVIAGDASNITTPLSVRFDGAAGNYDVRLVVSTPHCVPTAATESVSVAEPLPPATVNCDNVGFDQVGFVWSHPTATDFNVVILDQPAGATITQDANSLLATGLAEGESVTISVGITDPGPCNDVAGTPVTCTAQSCPDVTPVITTPVDTFCLDGTATTIPLTVTVPVTGNLSWAGPGVTGATFDPVAAGVGAHILTVTYTEGTCSYLATIELVVVAQPNVS
ncbi:MAG: hypothetical protein AAFZ52_11515, partial [Bacteroidota bacterium]